MKHLNCENCGAGWSGEQRWKGLQYMFYHALGSDHETGYEDEIEDKYDL